MPNAKKTSKTIKPDVAALVLSLHEKFDTKVDGISTKIEDLRTYTDTQFHNHLCTYEKDMKILQKYTKWGIITILGSVIVGALLAHPDSLIAFVKIIIGIF